MEKQIPSKFKVRIVAQGDLVQDIFAEAIEFFDKREVRVGRKEVRTPISRDGNMFEILLSKIYKSALISYEDVYETKVARGYDVWFHFGGKAKNFKLEKSEVEKLIETGEWVIID